MVKLVKRLIRNQLNKFGFDFIKIRYDPNAKNIPNDIEDPVRAIIKRVMPYTMTSSERISSLYQAVQYITINKIEGAIVECGVWKGGSMMAAMMVLVENKVLDREFFLYDTYEGMSAPTEFDKAHTGQTAAEQMAKADRLDQESIWCLSTLDEVQKNIASTGYPAARIKYIKGMVEDSIPATLPGKIALLRLDTDFYESTLHELEHLFPLLVKGGVLIIDDYGHWQGARKAVDEYIAENKVKILLNRIDYSGRLAVKTE